MEIQGIRSTLPFMFPSTEKESANVQQSRGDVVDVHAPQILADEEVEGVFNETLDMIAQDSTAALSVHSGLTESRVFALLGL